DLVRDPRECAADRLPVEQKAPPGRHGMLLHRTPFRPRWTELKGWCLEHCNGAAGRRRLPWALALLAALSVLAVVLRAAAALALPFLFPDEGAYALLGRGLWGATGVDARRGADARAVFARLRRHDRRGGDLPTARRARLVARGPRARLAVAPQPAAARRHAR